ncbi:MAG: hypothetical protein IJ415_03905 [Clostridia bacterium]|nr:hypothetical protein [Clostridia bacterium]
MKKKTPEELLKDFQKELEENDKKVAQEINKKTDEEKAKEFAMFIKKNKCKVIGGGKNGK